MTFVSGTIPTPDPSPPDDPGPPEDTPADGRAVTARTRLSGRDLALITVASLVIAFGVAIAVVTLSNRNGAEQSVSVDEFLTQDDPGAADGAPQVGDLMPNLELQRFDGTSTTLDELLDRPLVLNVWASTCTPCLREMPDFEAVYQDLGDEVGFLGLDSGESAEEGAPFAAQVGATYPLAEDPDQAHSTRLGLVALPMTLFVNADGTLAHRELGAMDEAKLRANIDEHLGVAS